MRKILMTTPAETEEAFAEEYEIIKDNLDKIQTMHDEIGYLWVHCIDDGSAADKEKCKSMMQEHERLYSIVREKMLKIIISLPDKEDRAAEILN